MACLQHIIPSPASPLTSKWRIYLHRMTLMTSLWTTTSFHRASHNHTWNPSPALCLPPAQNSRSNLSPRLCVTLLDHTTTVRILHITNQVLTRNLLLNHQPARRHPWSKERREPHLRVPVPQSVLSLPSSTFEDMPPLPGQTMMSGPILSPSPAHSRTRSCSPIK